uniref:N-acetyltransferase domain-containing protein n=1 Tax=Haemonchus contortus TaxID=6289 RepID=A0A7I5E524_HAECO
VHISCFLRRRSTAMREQGRSLVFELLQQLRQQAAGSIKGEKLASSKGRKLHELTMEESIRYKPGDEIEQWLNRVLCLNAGNINTTSFLWHSTTERMRIVHCQSRCPVFFPQSLRKPFYNRSWRSICSAMLQLITCRFNVSSEGGSIIFTRGTCTGTSLFSKAICRRESVIRAMNKGKRAAGDLLPWTISQQFLDHDFPTLCGGRIVRIAVHPDFQSMGYGVKESVKTVKDGHTVALLEGTNCTSS